MGTGRTLIVCCVLASLSPLMGRSAQQVQQEKFKIEGIVVNSATGRPIPRALVQCNGRFVLTGTEGEFWFDGMAAGRVQLNATKPGYFPPGANMQGGMVVRNGAGNMVEVGADTGRIVLKLAPEAVIFGHVTGDEREPLEGANVQVLGFVSVEGRRQLMPGRGSSTDEDGNFRIAGLPAGRYYLDVRAGNATRRVLGARVAKAPQAYPAVIYYPGTGDLAAATAIDLAPGQRMEVEFSLSLAPAYTLAGAVVTTGDWKQLNPPAIFDAMEQPLFGADRFDAQSGAFEFRAVPAGVYTLRLGGTDMADRYQFSNHRITVAKTATDLRFTLRPGANIPVVIRTEFNKPFQGGSCSYGLPNGEIHHSDCTDFPAARLELIGVDSSRLRFSSDYRPVQEPSAFGFHAVPPGRYLVRAQASFGGYVQSVRCGNLDLFREELIVPENGQVMPIEVVVRDDSAMLKITVRAGKPGQPATVVVFPDGVLLAARGLIAGSSNGEVSVGPLAPGSYKVFAFDSIAGIDYADGEALARYAANAASVMVAANGQGSVTVDLIHTGE